MRVKQIGETFDILKQSRQISLDLEKVVIENVGALEVLLNKGQETKEYWINVCYQANAEQKCGETRVYQSENFKNKKKAKKEYNRILKMLENGNYTLKSNLRGNLRLDLYLGEYLLQLVCKRLEKCFKNKEE